MFVKLCGLRTLTDAQAAIEAGASALGFILAESKRQVMPGMVASVREDIAMPPTIVGVTVNNTADELMGIFESARLDMLQLSGDEPISILDELDVPVIKALRFPAGTSIDHATEEVDRWLSHRHAPELVMVDSHHGSAHGGTGMVADWKLVSEIAVRYPIVLAGGLDPDNVAEAIRRVGPIGVDASSGTESGGIKDPAKMNAFVRTAREAFARY